MQLCRRNTSYIFFSFSTEETQVKFSFFFYTGAQFYTFLSFDQGMKYIHDSPLESHGSLRSACCLIDSRWVLKVCDFGLHWLTCHDGSTEGSHKHQKGWWGLVILIALLCVYSALFSGFWPLVGKGMFASKNDTKSIRRRPSEDLVGRKVIFWCFCDYRD